jgi:hypothetical protein
LTDPTTSKAFILTPARMTRVALNPAPK